MRRSRSRNGGRTRGKYGIVARIERPAERLQLRVLVLGAYGLIGLEVARRLAASGHDVVGLARKPGTGRRLLPQIRWRSAELALLTCPEAWTEAVRDIDVVVNASGALQRGSRDDLVATQQHAIVALIAACEARGVKRFVQISAPGATEKSSTEFMRTKAAADAALARSTLDWIVLRPGLVIARNAYGGTAMLRALAAFPLLQPIVLGDRLVQTVALTDVVDIVADACTGRLPSRSDLDLVEAQPHALRDIVRDLRAWFGFRPAYPLAVPSWIAWALATVGDGLGYLGWRPPLRSTSLQALAENIVGDPQGIRAVTGRNLATFGETLASMPATLQERWFARLYLALPAAVATLAAFWALTGVIALLRLEAAAAVIAGSAMAAGTAEALVLAGGLVDIALGSAIVYRPSARGACLGMIATTGVYWLAGTLLRPDLWIDPLGPLLKSLPALLLAGLTWILLEER